MDTISLLIEKETLKKKMDNAEAFLEELIHYIFVVCKEDDYITPEVICRKLYKYGFIDKKDGEWVADTPQKETIEKIAKLQKLLGVEKYIEDWDIFIKMQSTVSTSDSENAKYSKGAEE